MKFEDLAQVFAISEQQFGAHSWQLGMFEQELETSGHYSFVVEENGKVVSFVSYMLTEGEIGEEYNILNIATARGYENRGYASALLQFLKENALANNYAGLWLEVRKSNVNAINFYRYFGFKESYVRKRYYSNGEDALIMNFLLRNS